MKPMKIVTCSAYQSSLSKRTYIYYFDTEEDVGDYQKRILRTGGTANERKEISYLLSITAEEQSRVIQSLIG